MTLNVLFFAAGRYFGQPYGENDVFRPQYLLEITTVTKELLELHLAWPIDRLVHGDGRGGDQHAKVWCDRQGVQAVGYPASWTYFRKAAGPTRIAYFVDDWALRADTECKMLALPGGTGTARTVELIEDASRARIDRGWTCIEVVDRRKA